MNRRDRRKAGQRGNQGPLQVQMALKGDQVIIEFGVAIKWFGMNITDAEEFSGKLRAHIDQLKLQALSAERSH